MRHIIIHNHLFKNAGTSVDHILERNFGTRWVSGEFTAQGAENSAQLAAWIGQHPQAIAFSSHTITGPLPELADVRLIPIVLLRDPVERVASAYRFERLQDAQTKGAVLAKQHGLAGYVHARLSIPGDRQCRNFQTSRLAALLPSGQGSELDRARAAAQLIARQGVLGLVSDFAGAMRRLNDLVAPFHLAFRSQPVTVNASHGTGTHAISPQMRTLLQEANTDDADLLAFVRDLLDQAATGAKAPQLAGMV